MSKNVTKNDLNVISNLIFDSYLTDDFFYCDTYFTIRTLTADERTNIGRKYRYLTERYNLLIVTEMLAQAVQYIGGIKVDHEKALRYLLKVSSNIILEIYKHYTLLEEKISKAGDFLDFYIETRESRNSWHLFKTCSKNIDFVSIKKVNQYQYYWVVMNVFKDQTEHEKREWVRTEYMTNTICSFVNPKAYKQVKSKMNVSEQFEDDEEKKRAVEHLETEGELTIETEGDEPQDGVKSKDVFANVKKRHGESEDEHAARLDNLMERALSYEPMDEFDKAIRDKNEILMANMLIDRRKKAEIERLKNNDVEVLGDDFVEEGDFCYLGINYIQIIQERAFNILSIERKKEIFNECMQYEFKLDDAFLKDLSNDANKVEYIQDDQERLKGYAEKAASMTLNLEPKDLMQKKVEKASNIVNALERRNAALNQNSTKIQDDDVDVIEFED